MNDNTNHKGTSRVQSHRKDNWHLVSIYEMPKTVENGVTVMGSEQSQSILWSHLLGVFPHNNLLLSPAPAGRWKLRHRGVECWQDCPVSDRDRTHPQASCSSPCKLAEVLGWGVGRTQPRVAALKVWTGCNTSPGGPLETPTIAPHPGHSRPGVWGQGQQPIVKKPSRPCPYPQDGEELA